MEKINTESRLSIKCPYYDNLHNGICTANLFIDSPFCRGHICLYKMPKKDIEKAFKIKGSHRFYD